MNLADLAPRWLTKDGRRVGFTFRSPADQKWRQSCFPKPPGMSEQMALFDSHHNDEGVQGCNSSATWTIAGGIDAADFATMTVTPSLDGSQGGLWHGHITNGKIVGGV